MCALLMLFEDFGEDFCYSKVGKNITFFIAMFFEGLSNNQGPTELVISSTIFLYALFDESRKTYFLQKTFFS